MKTFRIGGIYPTANKLTADVPTIEAELPEQAVFPLSQHIGDPAIPVVRKGDAVKVGTLIAEAGGIISAPIYSSVSGTVLKIDTVSDETGNARPSIVINVEGDEWEPSIDRSNNLETLAEYTELTPDEIINRIKWAGVTGMGGAGMPTYVKLTTMPYTKAECVILNGVECEPYITADYRLMTERADEVLVGLDLLMRAAKVERGYIGIGANMPSAIALMQQKAANDDRVEIVPLQAKYPQGGEKQLVDAVLHRQVPAPPAVTANVGAIVINVATAFAVYEAVMKHKPLFERYVTVSGKEMAHPANFLVRIGTPIRQLIDACGGLPVSDNKILWGGPMRGVSLDTLDVPVVKGLAGLTIMSGSEVHRHTPEPCIRCAKCVDVCPMGLEPYLLARLSMLKKRQRAEREQITSCIECGSCQFACPSYRPLLDYIRTGKEGMESLSPHMHGGDCIKRNTYGVIFALVPALLMAVFSYGLNAIYLGCYSLLSCLLAEWGITRYLMRRPCTLADGTAVITALVMTLCLPARTPFWAVALGAVGAIGLGKFAFGGLGRNGVNPAIVGVCVALLCPGSSALTPGVGYGAKSPYLFAMAIMLGLAFMLWKRIITWHIPLSIILTTIVLTGILAITGTDSVQPLSLVLGGGTLLGAVFMATDYTTSPMSHPGKIVYGIAIAAISVYLHMQGESRNAMLISIFIMNILTPLVDRYCKPRRYGKA